MSLVTVPDGGKRVERPERAVAAGCLDGDAQPRPGAEHRGEREQLDARLHELAGRQRRGVGFEVGVPRAASCRRLRRIELAVARSQPAALHVALLAVGPQLGERDLEVGVGRGRAQPQVDAAGSGHRHVVLEHRAVERQRLAERQRSPVVRRVRAPDRARRAGVVGRRFRGGVVDVAGRLAAVAVG